MLLTREEKWKEIKLGRIFKSSDNMAIKNRGIIRESVYVSHLGSHTEFLEKLERQTCNLTNISVVADGAPWIWKYYDDYRPDATQILDYYHAVEKLTPFAQSYFENRDLEQQWIEQQKEYLLSDKVDLVIQEVEQSNCNKQTNKEKEKLLGYYRRNKKRMQYQTFQQKGLLIGSGAIESAHRNVLQKRLKLSGQRWTKSGCQQVANLRVTRLSNEWDKLISEIKTAA